MCFYLQLSISRICQAREIPLQSFPRWLKPEDSRGLLLARCMVSVLTWNMGPRQTQVLHAVTSSDRYHVLVSVCVTSDPGGGSVESRAPYFTAIATLLSPQWKNQQTYWQWLWLKPLLSPCSARITGLDMNSCPADGKHSCFQAEPSSRLSTIFSSYLVTKYICV